MKFFSKTRLQEGFIVAFATLITVYLGIIFFAQNTGDIEKEISQIYFRNQEGENIFFHVPILLHYHLHQSVIYGNFARNNPEQAKSFFFKYASQC